MFRRRIKKEFPQGTFIPKGARIAAILQLCLAFTAILYLLSYPFMGTLFEHKGRTLLYRATMGDASLAANHQGYEDKLRRNHKRFEALPTEVKAPLIEAFNTLQKEDSRPFLSQLNEAIRILLMKIPPLELGWLILAIVIPLLLLMKIEGARQAAWLLPLVAACYGWHNYQYGSRTNPEIDAHLFPSEETLVAEYLKTPLSGDISSQQRELMKGWQLYLVDQWAHEAPNDSDFEQQVEKGEFAFNLARLQLFSSAPIQTKDWYQAVSPYLLFLYFLWNLFFAWTVNRRCNHA